MVKVPGAMPAYTYGEAAVATSPVSLEEFEQLKVSVGFTADDERYLRKAGEVLEGQTKQIVAHWRSGITASIPNLAQHSRTLEGEPIPQYVAQSNLPLRTVDSRHLPASLRSNS